MLAKLKKNLVERAYFVPKVYFHTGKNFYFIFEMRFRYHGKSGFVKKMSYNACNFILKKSEDEVKKIQNDEQLSLLNNSDEVIPILKDSESGFVVPGERIELKQLKKIWHLNQF